MPAALLSQAQIALAAVVWQARLLLIAEFQIGNLGLLQLGNELL